MKFYDFYLEDGSKIWLNMDNANAIYEVVGRPEISVIWFEGETQYVIKAPFDTLHEKFL